MVITDGSIVYAQNQHEQKWRRLWHVLPSITNEQWFHDSRIKQTRTEMVKIIMCRPFAGRWFNEEVH